LSDVHLVPSKFGSRLFYDSEINQQLLSFAANRQAGVAKQIDQARHTFGSPENLLEHWRWERRSRSAESCSMKSFGDVSLEFLENEGPERTSAGDSLPEAPQLRPA